MKKLLSVTLVLLLITTILPISSVTFARTTGDFEFELENGKAIITCYFGTDINLSLSSTLVGYPLVAIDDYAFEGCESLESVTIEEGGITTIGDGAFEGCTNLKEINLSNTVTKIGSSAFEGCESLREITIPANVTSIGSGIVDYCSKLESINVAEENANYLSVDGILYLKSKETILKCPEAKSGSVNIEDGVVYIAGSAFANCVNLTAVTIPENAIRIFSGAFEGCIGLTEITIPQSVKYINDGTFYGCSGLTTITIPKNVESIGDGAFDGCINLTEINVDSENANYLSVDGILYDKAKTKAIKCPEAKEGAIVIPTGVTTLKDLAFYGCNKITSIKIPYTVKTIGNPGISMTDGIYEFDGCENLEEIIVNVNNNNYSSLDGILYDKPQHTLIRCPMGKSGDLVIPDSVTKIDGYSVAYCSKLTSVIIPESVTSINCGAFCCCDGLTEITIPSNVKRFGDAVFAECINLEKVNIEEGVTNIGSNQFWGCTALTEITLPESLKEIASAAFAYTGITSITIPKNVKTIVYGAFNDCTELTEILVEDGNYDYSSIDGILCNKLGTGLLAYPAGRSGVAVIPDKISYISGSGFSSCNKLTSIVLPKNLTSISAGAFRNCTSLTSLKIPDSVKTIDNGTFDRCSSLTEIIIPEGVTTIYDYAFYDCTSLKQIIIPSTVTKIGWGMFWGCESLTDIYYNGTREEWLAIHDEDYSDEDELPTENTKIHYKGEWDYPDENSDVDLAVTAVSASQSSINDGDNINIYCMIRNGGSEDSTETIKVDFYYNGILFDTVYETASIKAGGFKVVQCEKAKSTYAGVHSIKAIINSDDNQSEVDKSNNALKSRIKVTDN